jgi:hypothetical protein
VITGQDPQTTTNTQGAACEKFPACYGRNVITVLTKARYLTPAKAFEPALDLQALCIKIPLPFMERNPYGKESNLSACHSINTKQQEIISESRDGFLWTTA